MIIYMNGLKAHVLFQPKSLDVMERRLKSFPHGNSFVLQRTEFLCFLVIEKKCLKFCEKIF